MLGSAQPAGIVSAPRAKASGTEVVRRRGGGGAVLLRPGDHLWVDAWIPRHDPLWDADVADAAAWVGAWWAAALGAFGVGDLTVHRGRAEPGRHGGLVCFAGRGPGEVLQGDRKVMGRLPVAVSGREPCSTRVPTPPGSPAHWWSCSLLTGPPGEGW